MPVNINGYNLSEAGGGLALGASASRIYKTNYGIRDPMLPAMNGGAIGGGLVKVHPFPINNADVNINSVMSLSTYLFTCPVLGLYYISWAYIAGDGNQRGTAGYYSVITNGVLRYFTYRDTVAVWELQHIEVVLRCGAGDTISLAAQAAPGPDSGSTGGAYAGNHNSACICLIG